MTEASTNVSTWGNGEGQTTYTDLMDGRSEDEYDGGEDVDEGELLGDDVEGEGVSS